MALARIFSRYPEQTTALSQQLQQQGYKVEVLSPDEAPTTLADLEIQLEVCDPADVLRRAAELAARLHADIAVAPGALLTAASEEGAPAQESTPSSAVPLVTAAEPEPAILPATTETRNDAAEEAAKPSRSAQAARASGAVLAAAAAGAGELLAWARAEFREHLERARVRAAEARQRRQERLLELTRRRAEAQQNAVALEKSRRAAAAYLLQLQREYPDDQRAPGMEPAARRGQWRIGHTHVRKWETVLAGVASATALFMAGLALASFHSRPAASERG